MRSFSFIAILIVLTLAGFSGTALSKPSLGKVCLGSNLAKPLSEHTERLYLTIGNSDKLYFMRPYTPRVVVEHLDVHKNHTVNVYFDNVIVESWKINFSKLKTNTVLIWRAGGSWRMDAIKESSCI